MLSDSVMYTNDNNYTLCGHIVGMLDRDERTAKLRCNSMRETKLISSEVHHSHSHYCVHPRNHKHSHDIINHRYLVNSRRPHFNSRKNSYLWNTIRRLHQVLIVGIYLISLVSVPYSLSAPTRLEDMTDTDQPKWINPCGIDMGTVLHTLNIEVPKVSDLDLLTSIINQARIALSKANQFKDDFARQIFNSNIEKLHKNWKQARYEWLPQESQIPKSLNEPVPEEHLEMLKMDNALVDTYEHLQKIAVGLEQVVQDQEREGGPLVDNFKQSELNLRLVLCELQMATYERGIHNKLHPDVTRDLMPDYLRNDKVNTSRNLRDWIIYRDYMNTLEYVIQVFDYFKSKL